MAKPDVKQTLKEILRIAVAALTAWLSAKFGLGV